jgi:YVTN family beta-propeller protein
VTDNVQQTGGRLAPILASLLSSKKLPSWGGNTGFIPTGKGTHGLYVSRDSRVLYISNRGEGSVSVLDLATSKVIQKWQVPNGGSPDMGGVSADGNSITRNFNSTQTFFASCFNAQINCESERVPVTGTINPPATSNAGVDQTVCANNPNVTLAGIVGGSAT